MDADNLFRRLRGALGNALVWGGGWFTLALTTFAALRVAGIAPEGSSWLDAFVIAAKAGALGTIAGGAFSTVVGLLYRGRRLSEIGPVRFGVAGSLVTGLFVPAFFQAMNLLSGDGPVPMAFVLDDALWTALFGGVVAGGSLELARRADRVPPGGGEDPLRRLEGAEARPGAGSGSARDPALLAGAADRRPRAPASRDEVAGRG